MAGGRRTTVAPGATSASCQGEAGASGAAGGGPSGRAGGGGASVRTIVAGEAVPKKEEAGPAQRQAAQSATSTTDGGGPQPSHDLRGSTWRPSTSATASSTTQPRTLRPCSGARTRVPTTTGCSQLLGTA